MGGPHCSLRPIIRPRQNGIWDCRLHIVEYFKRALLEHDMNRVGYGAGQTLEEYESGATQ